MFNWYGFIIGCAMLLCIVCCYFIAKKRGYYEDLVFDIALFTIPLAIVGARLYYVVFDALAHPNYWDFARIFDIQGGGLAIYGGLLGACAGGGLLILFMKRFRKPEKRATFLQMADLAFTFIILGQAIGRWGNFINQEAYGQKVTSSAWQWFPYAVHITSPMGNDAAGWYQATFFYESMWNLIGFGLLLFLYLGRRKSFDGFNFAVYCLFYGTGRIFIEGLRSDSLMLGIFRFSQLLSAAVILLGLVIIIVHVRRADAHGKKPFIFIDGGALNSDYFDYEKSILYLRTLYKKPEPPEKLNKGEPGREPPADGEDAFADTQPQAPTDAGENAEAVEDTDGESVKSEEILKAVEDELFK